MEEQVYNLTLKATNEIKSGSKPEKKFYSYRGLVLLTINWEIVGDSMILHCLFSKRDLS